MCIPANVRNRRKLRDGMHTPERCALRHRQSVPVGVDHAAKRQRRIVREIVLERPADGHAAFDKREVCLFDSLRRELSPQCFKCLSSSGHKHQSRRVGIDSMQRSCHQGTVPDGLAFRKSGHDSVHKSRSLAARNRLHGNSRRLVERKQAFVFEHYIDGYGCIRLHHIVRCLGEFRNRYGFSSAKLESLCRASPVYKYVTALNSLAHERARR